MIKLIAFDLVGVLAFENDFELTEIENKIEHLFGENNSDAEFIENAKLYLKDEKKIIDTATTVINHIYEIKNQDIFNQIKQYNSNIKLVIATNHISSIRTWINSHININQIDEIYISAELGFSKPNSKFYDYILTENKIEPSEMLFIDDSMRNLDGANALGIKTIWFNGSSGLGTIIINYLKNSE